MIRFLLGILSCTILACTASRFSQKPFVSQLTYQGPLPSEQMARIQNTDQKDATLYALLQAFSILRFSPLTPQKIEEAKGYLAYAQDTFSDLKNPSGLEVAFHPDASFAYRGRPYERIATALWLGLLDMSQGRCDMAIPAFNNALYFTLRSKQNSIGTTAPLIHALLLRCLIQNRSSKQDIERTKENLFRSLRMALYLEPLHKLLEESSKNEPRYDAAALQTALLLFHASLADTLALSEGSTPEEWIGGAGQYAGLSLRLLQDRFDTQYETLIEPAIKSIQKTLYHKRIGNKKYIEALVFQKAPIELQELQKKLLRIYRTKKHTFAALDAQYESMKTALLKAVEEPKLALEWKGMGPKVELAGSHLEEARIIPSKTALPLGQLVKSNSLAKPCGLSRQGNSLWVVLCHAPAGPTLHLNQTSAYALWSTSHEATHMMGRRFDKILKGRAQFKDTTRATAETGLYTSLALFHLGANIAESCDRLKENSTCEYTAMALYGAGAVVLVLSGTIWIAGKMVQAQADDRYIPTLYEQGLLYVD